MLKGLVNLGADQSPYSLPSMRKARERARLLRIPLKPIQIAYTPAQNRIFNGRPVRFRVVPGGRQSGKTRGALYWWIHYGLTHPGTVNWWIAPVYRQGKRVFRLARRIIPPALVKDVSITELRIELVDGTVFEWLSADNPDNIVGETVTGAIVFDECGTTRETVWVDHVQPVLMVAKGPACFIGSPRGRNWFYRLWLQGHDPESPEWVSYRLPAFLNPFMPRSELLRTQQEMPVHLFRQNLLAHFLESAAAVFSYDQDVLSDLEPGHPKAGHVYIAGVDFAKHVDFTVVVVYCASTRRPVHYERFKRLSWNTQVEKLRAIGQKYPGEMWVDSTGVGDPLYDFLVAGGVNAIPYRFTNESKRALIERHILHLERGELYLYNDPHGIVRGEHDAFEFDISKSGRIIYDSPEGVHSDTVMASALAGMGLAGHPIGGKIFDFGGGTRRVFADDLFSA